MSHVLRCQEGLDLSSMMLNDFSACSLTQLKGFIRVQLYYSSLKDCIDATFV